MRSISEILAHARQSEKTIKCPYSKALMHDTSCVCMGTGAVTVCEMCDGTGWDRPNNQACKSCRGHGALAAPKVMK